MTANDAGLFGINWRVREPPLEPAAVAASGIPELAGLPNTLAGWGMAFLQLRKSMEATNAVLGVHIYAVGGNPDAARRNAMLVDWENAPSARLAHPREDHLLPLMVAAGAAGADRGDRLFLEHAMGVDMGSYRFPALS